MPNSTLFIKRFILSAFFLIQMSIGLFAQLTPSSDRCGTMNLHNFKLKNDPAYRATRREIDKLAQSYVQNAKKSSLVGGIVVIPVAFHVIYRTTTQNISDAQINAQIKQLNDDYRRINSDRNATPAAFRGAAKDLEIQFCLATRDPSGLATTGITRTSTTTTAFDDVTFEAQKTSTIWNRNKYLNLWSANLSGTLLGYAQFPGGPASTDGVVLRYSTVGSIANPGTLTGYNLGRTASHEVGHWLNLYHIWGDDRGACTGTDQVFDTPNQGDESSGTPNFPLVDICAPTSPGVMFMNYMDYSDDVSANMFTNGQKTRMLSALSNFRSTILSSNGCIPPTLADYVLNANVGTQTTCAGSSLDYTVLTTAYNSYNTSIGFSTSGLPAGCTASFSASSVAPGNPTNVSLTVGGGVAAGFYHFFVNTTSGASNADAIALTFWVLPSSFSNAPILSLPLNNATGQSTTPLFTWNGIEGATLYDFQLSTIADFSNIILTQNNIATNSAFVPTTTPLSNLTTYYWRVMAKNNCASSPFATGNFTTGNITCSTINSTDVPKTISSVAASLVTSTLNFPSTGTVTDVNVTNIGISHTYIQDLTITLRSPNSTDITLLSEPCAGQTAINMGFDDQTSNAVGSYPCPPNNGLLYQPDNFLTPMNGANASGTWTLRVEDSYDGDGGSLNAWGLRVCVNNNSLPVELLDFKAKSLKNVVQLNWKTAFERNNAGFEIQRSTDPLSIFTKIGFVKGHGNSTQTIDYQNIDSDVKAGTTYYYRLRQLDFDDKETFSKVEAVNLDKNIVWDISLSPNPAESVLNIEILGTMSEAITLDLYSIQGQLVSSKKMTADNSTTTLDLTPLSNGVYFLKCQTGSNHFIKKIVKK